MENLVSEHGAPSVRLKRLRLVCVCFLADAVLTMQIKRWGHVWLSLNHETAIRAGCQFQAPGFELSAPAGTGRKRHPSSSMRKQQEKAAGGTKE